LATRCSLTLIQELITMNVALYARVSTKQQEKHGTIGSQLETLRRYAKAQGFEIAEDYVLAAE
jgi:DNA invertase Pin-like site-specific DNA recombinase